MTIQQLIDLLEQVPNKDQIATAQFHTRDVAGKVIDCWDVEIRGVDTEVTRTGYLLTFPKQT